MIVRMNHECEGVIIRTYEECEGENFRVNPE